MRRRRTLWSEEVPYARLAEPALLAELAARGLDLCVAVTPERADAAAGIVRACRDAGVGVALWPMLDDADGRWASAGNALQFRDFTSALLSQLQSAGALPDELAIDLEPPIRRVRQLLRGDPRPLATRNRSSIEPFRTLLSEITSLGVHPIAAAVPMTAVGARSGPGWERLLGTPVEGLAFDRVSVMAYSSLFEGYSRGFLDRADARVVLYRLAVGAAARFGSRASISLGCVGAGALGDESTYRSPGELADDVSLARAAGVDDLALFDLGGLLARAPLGPWLDAFCQAAPGEAPVPTARARGALALARAGGRVAAALRRVW
jgi:hypothetical protein